MQPDEARAYLYGRPRFALMGQAAYRPGLERVQAVLERMEAPHRAFRVVHVAGTNGKGSTSAMIAAALQTAGYRVGLYTSPHLLDFPERIRVQGQPVSWTWIAGTLERYRPAFEAHACTFFEMTTALAFRYFAEEGVDWAVVETGLGGRLDATNVVLPEVSVITRVGWDHQEVLGNTLEAIAREKGGIIKSGRPVVVARQTPEVLEVLRTMALARGSTLVRAEEAVSVEVLSAGIWGQHLRVACREAPAELRLPLAGAHQVENVEAALATLALLEVPRDAVRRGLEALRSLTGLRGRLECLQQRPLVVLDVAHNPEGLRRAVETLLPEVEGRLYVSLGWMRDKARDPLPAVLGHPRVTVLPVGLSDRGLSAEELGSWLADRGVRVLREVDPFHVPLLPEDGWLITGSHRVVEAYLAWRAERAYFEM